MIKPYFTKLLKRLIDIPWIETQIQAKKIQHCLQNVSIGNDSRFYEEARVYNFQNEKNHIRIGQGTHIRGELLIFPYGGKIHIGDNCYIGEYTRIWSANEISIGNHVLISHNVNIIDSNSHETNYIERAASYSRLVKEGHPKTKPNVPDAPIHISDYVWINFNAAILKGVTIGEGSIIAPNTVVLHNVPPFSIYAGNPGKVIKQL